MCTVTIGELIMGQKTRKALAAIHEALEEQTAELSQHGGRLDRLEKIVAAQAKDISDLEESLVALRNRSIQSAIDRGVPTKVVAQAHGLSSGRISQISPRKRPPHC